MRYDAQGKYVDDFIDPGAGGLGGSRAISFGPNGDLYVDSPVTDQVLRYDAQSGDFVGVAASGFDGPVGLTFDSRGHMFVGAALSNEALEYDTTGNLVRRYTMTGTANTMGVLVDDDTGLLYVARSITNEILRFDTETGEFVDVFAQGQGLNIPIGLAFMPDGSLIAGAFGNDFVLQYDVESGDRLGVLITRWLGGLDGTHNFAFIPAPGTLSGVLGAGLSIRERTPITTTHTKCRTMAVWPIRSRN